LHTLVVKNQHALVQSVEQGDEIRPSITFRHFVGTYLIAVVDTRGAV
jgi:hypothetical protein